MSIPSRNYFIVIDRNREHRKELLFNVNFFYLKTMKKKGSFSYINKPFFRGIVLFGLDMKDKMRPLKFDKITKENNIRPVDPDLFKKFLLADRNKFIAFSDQTDPEDNSPVIEMLNNFQFDKEKIKDLTFCATCLENNEFKILNEKNQIKSFKSEIICAQCAMEKVMRGAKVSGLLSGDKSDSRMKNLFNHLISKQKDINKILKIFRSDFDPAKNKEITLYDVEESTPISQKYLDVNLEVIDIPGPFRNLLKASKINKLLPIQALSVDRGLLSGSSQLIMAPTSGGKTLVGELAGVSKLLKYPGAKMLYLVPIVALANIRTEEFKVKYNVLNLKIVKRIGESIIEKREEDNLEDLISADIIIATYEAIDFLLRSGNKSFLGENVKTIIIDEIQTLIDPERGFLLDGFIARLKYLYPDSQYLYLSATVGEPETLALKLNCSLIRYTNRPVPIERHLILCVNEQVKQRHISSLVKGAFKRRSNYGFRGQSIVFTNTRKKCETLTDFLKSRGVILRAYHSGLTGEERQAVEGEFLEQKIAGVVATAALAAGVDLPASQVIFESLAMGIHWLTVAEFEQMLGRAGRLKKHDLGLAYLLVEPGRVVSPRMKNITEENVAIRLLRGKIKDFELPPDEDRSLTELLAFISIFNESINRETFYQFYQSLINNDYKLDLMIRKLNSLKLIRIKEDFTYNSTRLGRSIAQSFLTVERSMEIMEELKNKSKGIIDIALNIEPLKNVYLSKNIVADLAKNVNMKYFSNNLFSASVLSLMNAEYIKKKRGNFSTEFVDFISKWITDIFNCKCKDSPYCECGRLNLEKMILSLRIDDNFSVEDIGLYLKEHYKILIFKGDILDYLENLIYSLESVKNISEGISNLDEIYKKEISEIPSIIEKIKFTS